MTGPTTGGRDGAAVPLRARVLTETMARFEQIRRQRFVGLSVTQVWAAVFPGWTVQLTDRVLGWHVLTGDGVWVGVEDPIRSGISSTTAAWDKANGESRQHASALALSRMLVAGSVYDLVVLAAGEAGVDPLLPRAALAQALLRMPGPDGDEARTLAALVGDPRVCRWAPKPRR